MSDLQKIMKVDDNSIIEVFEREFEEQVGKYVDISSFDATCVKDHQNGKIVVEVAIYGCAGSPTIDDFRKDRVKKASSVVLERADFGKVTFKLVPEKTVFVTTNDYTIIYEA